jgi:hypothetical protein
VVSLIEPLHHDVWPLPCCINSFYLKDKYNLKKDPDLKPITKQLMSKNKQAKNW